LGGGKRKKGRGKKFSRHLTTAIMTTRIDQEEALPKMLR